MVCDEEGSQGAVHADGPGTIVLALAGDTCLITLEYENGKTWARYFAYAHGSYAHSCWQSCACAHVAMSVSRSAFTKETKEMAHSHNADTILLIFW